MAVFTIAGLTLREAVRRKTLVGALLLGLLVLGISCILMLIRVRMQEQLDAGRITSDRFITQYTLARGAITMLCVAAIRIIGSIFAILLAGGAISGEIERGLLAVILPKPIPRWQIFFGKWIGLNIVLAGSVLAWTAMAWASLTWQTRLDFTSLLRAGLYLALFPILICTLTLSLSTFAQRLLGTSLALGISALAWFDGILNGLGKAFDVDALKSLSLAAGFLMPQGTIAWWVQRALGGLAEASPFGRGPNAAASTDLRDWGILRLNAPHFDTFYVAAYLLAVFLLGVLVFKRRDV